MEDTERLEPRGKGRESLHDYDPSCGYKYLEKLCGDCCMEETLSGRGDYSYPHGIDCGYCHCIARARRCSAVTLMVNDELL